MVELIHEHAVRVEDADGAVYLPRTYGEMRVDGTWRGWIEFHPLIGAGRVLSTGQEPVYFEGALVRAIGEPR